LVGLIKGVEKFDDTLEILGAVLVEDIELGLVHVETRKGILLVAVNVAWLLVGLLIVKVELGGFGGQASEVEIYAKFSRCSGGGGGV